MTKIYVDEMPKHPGDCPFSIPGNYVPSAPGVNAHVEFTCPLWNGYPCDLVEGNPCEHLAELPKGDKENGSSQD